MHPLCFWCNRFKLGASIRQTNIQTDHGLSNSLLHTNKDLFSPLRQSLCIQHDTGMYSKLIFTCNAAVNKLNVTTSLQATVNVAPWKGKVVVRWPPYAKRKGLIS